MIGRKINSFSCLGSRSRGLGTKSSLTRVGLLSPEVICYIIIIVKGFKKTGLKNGYNWDLHMRIRK